MSDPGAAAPPAGGGLTQREESFRDRLLRGLVDRLPCAVTPNRLSWLRITLVLIAFILYLRRAPLALQLAFLVMAGLTDLIDGPLARRRGLCSLPGARLDQRADTLLGVWLGVLAVLEAGIPLPIVVGLVAGQAAIWGTDLALHRSIRSGLAVGPDARPRPTFASRLQLVLVVSGFCSLLGEAAFGWPTRRLGLGLLVGAVGAAIVQVSQSLESRRGLEQHGRPARP